MERLQWMAVHQGSECTFDVEPDTAPIQRGLLQMLPIEAYL